MMADRVLVTGGAGFVGRHTVARFLAAGHPVRVLALPGEALPGSWAGRVEVLRGNILDPNAVAAAASGCARVVHLAGLVGHPGDYALQWSIFVDGSRTVAQAAADAGARLVVASSIAVYGTAIQSGPCPEEIGHHDWAGAYGRAKQGQEMTALEVAARHGLSLTLIRPANVYGEGPGGAWGDRLVEAIRVSGGALIGTAEQNNAGLVHVSNLADALVLAATHPAAVGRTYNVCDDLDVSWARFMTDMAAMAGRASLPVYPLDAVLDLIRANEDPAQMIGPRDTSLPFMEGVNLVGFDNRFPSERIRSELGWRPKVTYEDAIGAMRAYYSREPNLQDMA